MYSILLNDDDDRVICPKTGPDNSSFLTYRGGIVSDMSRGGFPVPSSADNEIWTACPWPCIWTVTFYTLAFAGLSTIEWLNSYAVQEHCTHKEKFVMWAFPAGIWTTDHCFVL